MTAGLIYRQEIRLFAVLCEIVKFTAGEMAPWVNWATGCLIIALLQ